MDSAILYFDTSAVVPLLIEEPSTEICQKAWDAASVIVSSRLLTVEIAAALAKAERMGRITSAEHDLVMAGAFALQKDIDLVEISETLIGQAALLPRQFSLRGYDAVHVAAVAAFDGEAVMVSGDQQVIQACLSLGISVVNVDRAH